MKYFFAFLPIILLMLLVSRMKAPAAEKLKINDRTPIAKILEELGEPPSRFKPNYRVGNVSAEEGRYLVQTGFAKKSNGSSTSKQSAHFVCTSCHNIQRDEPDLSIVDPDAKLDFVEERGLPFLQGTALYGAVNRDSFYNGDYYQKYGDLVNPARNNLREAIQLCAIECAQGRPLKDWEIESILAYLWKIDLKLGDLFLNSEEIEFVESAMEQEEDQARAVQILKSKYLQASPATFNKPPKDRKAGYTAVKAGDPQNGKRIYELSCLHCHEDMRYSFFALDDTKFSFDFLEKHIPRYTRYSLYQVGRYGTSPMPGKRSYMPHYTLEKMNNQQMEDLRAYIEQEAKR
ncbi:MAG: cytochrome c [Bacteroidota bacterium]